MNEQRPVLDQLNLVVGDMAATVAFYRLLGLEMPDMIEPWADHHRPVGAGDHVDVDLDSAAFAQQWDQGWGQGPGTVIGFRVASRREVDELFDRLTSAGHPPAQGPYDAFWGARYAIVQDPDGRHIGIMSPADDAHRTAPLNPPGSA